MPSGRKTPPAGYPIVQSGEDRDAAALKKRRQERAASKGEVALQASEASAAPVVAQDDDVTSPIDLIDVQRYHDDPEYRQDWDEVVSQFNENAAYRILWNRFGRFRRDSDSTAHASANAALAASAEATRAGGAQARIDLLEKELRDVSTVLRITKWILGFVIAATLASVITVVTKVFNWGVDSGEITVRLDHLEKDVDSIKRELDLKRVRGGTP